MAGEAHKRHPGGPAVTAARPSRPTGRGTWKLPAALAIALGLIVITAFALLPGATAQALIAEKTDHAFGTVRMQDGLLRVGFPLAVSADVAVTDLGTT